VTDPKPRECLGVPCFFAVPTSLWDDTDDRRLVQNGARSIVFNVTTAGMLDLLDKVDSYVKDQRTRKAWKRYLQKTRAEYIDPAVQLERSSRNGKSGDSQSEDEDDGAISDTQKRHPTEETAMSNLSKDSLPFYIKVQTRDTSTHFNASLIENVISGLRSEEATKSLSHEALSIYPVKPFTSVSFALLIMKNRGQRIEKSLFQSFPEFQRAFLHVKNIAEDLTEMSLAHGDVLPHNLLFDSRDSLLHVIDMDESSRDNDIPRRIVQYNENKGPDWFVALTYPNALRKEGDSYTKVQLAASFLQLSSLFHPSQLPNEVSNLVSNAIVLGESLCDWDKQNAEDDTSELQNEKKLKPIWSQVNAVSRSLDAALGLSTTISSEDDPSPGPAKRGRIEI
jgi:hypothetical protein